MERRATGEALRRAGRPSATLALPRVDARGLGELFMLLQIATVYAGALYGVDPLDQPGVELGKQLAGRIQEALESDADPDGRDTTTGALLMRLRELRRGR